MSVALDNAFGHYLAKSAAPPVTAVPFTMACWFNSDDITAHQVLVGLADNSVDDQVFFLAAYGSLAGDPIRAFARSGAAPHMDARTSTGYSLNTWHHACAVFATSTDGRVFIDGGSKGTDNTDRTPTGINTFSIGRTSDSTPSEYVSGMIAEPAVWDGALTADEVAALPHYSPMFIRPDRLVHYTPFILDDEYTPIIDAAGGTFSAPNGTDGTGDHPPIIYPATTRIGLVGPTAILLPNKRAGKGGGGPFMSNKWAGKQ
jgi:hypothetical protein